MAVVICFFARESGLKHIAQGEARLCERTLGPQSVNDELARITGDSCRQDICRPLRGLESFTTLTQGSARRASLHPGLYALARFAGKEPCSAEHLGYFLSVRAAAVFEYPELPNELYVRTRYV